MMFKLKRSPDRRYRDMEVVTNMELLHYLRSASTSEKLPLVGDLGAPLTPNLLNYFMAGWSVVWLVFKVGETLCSHLPISVTATLISWLRTLMSLLYCE